MKFWKTVGVKDIGPGGMMNDCKATLRTGSRAPAGSTRSAPSCAPPALRLSYHNHAFEFEKFPGDDRRKLDILMESTKPENLCAELDLAWAVRGRRRSRRLHPQVQGPLPGGPRQGRGQGQGGKKQQFKPLGQGELNWPEIFAAGRRGGHRVVRV